MNHLLLDASVWLAALDQDDRYHVASVSLIEVLGDDGAPAEDPGPGDPEAGARTIGYQAGSVGVPTAGPAPWDLGEDDAEQPESRARVEWPRPVALAALDLTLYEVANIAVVRWRSQADAMRAVELIRLACPAVEHVDDELIRDASTIAAENDLTVYDAAYVALARRRDWTLVSCDIKDLVQPGFAVTPDATPPSPTQ